MSKFPQVFTHERFERLECSEALEQLECLERASVFVSAAPR